MQATPKHALSRAVEADQRGRGGGQAALSRCSDQGGCTGAEEKLKWPLDPDA